MNLQIIKGDCLNILLTFQEFEFVEQLKVFQNLFYFAKMNPCDINENKTNKLEWKKARQFWKDVFPYIIEYNPIGAKPEQVKQIYKLNKIKENLEACLKQRDEIKTYSQTLVMLVDLILHIIKVRHDNIIYRTPFRLVPPPAHSFPTSRRYYNAPPSPHPSCPPPFQRQMWPQ